MCLFGRAIVLLLTEKALNRKHTNTHTHTPAQQRIGCSVGERSFRLIVMCAVCVKGFVCFDSFALFWPENSRVNVTAVPSCGDILLDILFRLLVCEQSHRSVYRFIQTFNRTHTHNGTHHRRAFR